MSLQKHKSDFVNSTCRHSPCPEDPFPCSYTWSHLPWRKKGVRMKGWEEEEVGSDCYLLTNTKGRNTKKPLLCTYPIVLNNQWILWSLNGSDLDFFFFFVLVWLNDLYLGCTGHLDVKTKKIRWSIQEFQLLSNWDLMFQDVFICSSGTNKLFLRFC